MKIARYGPESATREALAQGVGVRGPYWGRRQGALQRLGSEKGRRIRLTEPCRRQPADWDNRNSRPANRRRGNSVLFG